MKKTYKGIILALVLVVGSSVLAEDGSSGSEPRLGELMRGDIKKDREAFKQEAEKVRGETKNQIKENREGTKVDVKTMRANGATPEEIKAKIEATKAENDALREKRKATIDSAREKFRTETKLKIEKFKAERKILKQEKKDSILKTLSEKVFKVLDAELARIESLDQKLGDVIAERKAKGLDTTQAESLKSSAQTKLDEAKAAVTSAKESVASQISATEGVAKDAIKDIIRSAREKIVIARKAYREAIQALPKPAQDDEEENETENETEDNSNSSTN